MPSFFHLLNVTSVTRTTPPDVFWVYSPAETRTRISALKGQRSDQLIYGTKNTVFKFFAKLKPKKNRLAQTPADSWLFVAEGLIERLQRLFVIPTLRLG